MNDSLDSSTVEISREGDQYVAKFYEGAPPYVSEFGDSVPDALRHLADAIELSESTSDEVPREVVPDDGEKLRLLLRDERVDPDMVDMPEKGDGDE